MNRLCSNYLSLFLITGFVPMALYCQQQDAQPRYYRLTESKATAAAADSWLISLGSDREDLSYYAHSGATVLFNDLQNKAVSHGRGYLTVVPARGGAYFCVIQQSRAALEEEKGLLLLTVYDSAGDSSYQIQREKHFDEPMPAVLMRKNGGLVLGLAPLGRLWFYDNGGEAVAEMDLVPESEYDLERVLHLQEAAGDIAVLATRRGLAPAAAGATDRSGEPTVYRIDAKGSVKWRARLPGHGAGELGVSGDGRHFLTGSYSMTEPGDFIRTTTLLNHQGQRRWDRDILFRTVAFSAQGSLAVLADRSAIHVLDLDQVRERVVTDVDPVDGFVAALRIGGEPALIFALTAQDTLIDGDFLFARSKLNVFDQSGEVLQQISFDSRLFKSPALFISSAADRVGVGFRQELVLLEAEH